MEFRLSTNNNYDCLVDMRDMAKLDMQLKTYELDEQYLFLPSEHSSFEQGGLHLMAGGGVGVGMEEDEDDSEEADATDDNAAGGEE